MAIPVQVVKCAAGAKLEPFIYTFHDADGSPVDLTGFSSSATWLRHSDGSTGSFATTATGTTDGTVTFTAPAALTASADVVDVQVWAGNGGTTLLDGRRWRLVVQEAAGTAPSI